jgi:spermidine/putrescine transport system permease protein
VINNIEFAMQKSMVLRWYTSLLYVFLYVPIVLLIIFSFNQGPSTISWTGFTLDWYRELWNDFETWQALYNSLFIAVTSVLLTLFFGTTYVFYGNSLKTSPVRYFFYTVLGVPDIVLGVSLATLFVTFFLPLGVMTVIVGHVLLGFAYAIPIIQARYDELEIAQIEASYDLGASNVQTFFYVVLPYLMPALISSGLLVFIISLDDFVIAYFCLGADTVTLPLHVFALIRSAATPEVNALSTFMLALSFLFISIFFIMQNYMKMDEEY